ncbi:MAG: MXAN_5187 family protein [Polyangiaceae bacterium]
MMILSRMWYAILAILVAAAFYIVSLAVGQYNRRNHVAMVETLQADAQVADWALQLDARRRLDSLLLASVDPAVGKALRAANGKDPIPPASKDEGIKALQRFNGALPDDYKSDVLFLADGDGRLVAQTGFDSVNAFDKFELGGYPAVFDALHGYLRDDTWTLGGKMARVVARPVEDEVGQPPLGAIVALRWMDNSFAQVIGKRTGTNIAFFVQQKRVASAAMEGFDDKILEGIGGELTTLEADELWKEKGRTEVRPLGSGNDQGGVIFKRVQGEAWELGGGYAVARPRVMISSPMGFIQGADDKDKASVKLPIVIGLFVGTLIFGMLFSHLEHTVPLKGMVKQADRLKKGEVDAFQLPQFRGKYRQIAGDINAGIQRVVEKGGGTARKPADLESILGPVPAQPNMSAFSFPMSDPSAPPAAAPTAPGPPPPAQRFGHAPAPTPSGPQLPPERTVALGSPATAQMGGMGPGAPPPPAAGAPPAPAGYSGTMAASPQAHRLGNAGTVPAAFPPPGPGANGEGEEQTMVAQPSADLLAATGGGPAAPGPAAGAPAAGGDPTAEWKGVYEEFLRTKRECGEPTDGLTFEKFQQTLRKNRDALMSKHGCKRVKFSVYVKEGRASLKATPVRD